MEVIIQAGPKSNDRYSYKHGVEGDFIYKSKSSVTTEAEIGVTQL